uniref:CCHC-type domain-containing protein n=1 Tax=Panagrolaimus sp. ES5 TaxID=591445 RepID=A0AC34FP29_9BILA
MANYEDGLPISDFDERYIPEDECNLIPVVIERCKTHEKIVARNSRAVNRDIAKINDEVTRLHRQLQDQTSELNQQLTTLTTRLDDHETSVREANTDINHLRQAATNDNSDIQNEITEIWTAIENSRRNSAALHAQYEAAFEALQAAQQLPDEVENWSLNSPFDVTAATDKIPPPPPRIQSPFRPLMDEIKQGNREHPHETDEALQLMIDHVQQLQDENPEFNEPENAMFQFKAELTITQAETHQCLPIVVTTASYDGNPKQSVRKFLMEAEDEIIQNAGAFPQTNQMKVQKLRAKLRGRARRYFDTLDDAQTATFETASEALKEKFSDELVKRVADTRLMACYQQKGESVHAFSERLNDIILTLMEQEEEAEIERTLTREFKHRLTPRLRVEVLKTNPTTYEETLALALQVEAYIDEIDLINKHTTSSTTTTTTTTEVEPTPILVMEPQLCNYCKRPGHIVRDCRKLQFRQQQQENFENYCNQNQNFDNYPPIFDNHRNPNPAFINYDSNMNGYNNYNNYNNNFRGNYNNTRGNFTNYRGNYNNYRGYNQRGNFQRGNNQRFNQQRGRNNNNFQRNNNNSFYSRRTTPNYQNTNDEPQYQESNDVRYVSRSAPPSPNQQQFQPRPQTPPSRPRVTFSAQTLPLTMLLLVACFIPTINAFHSKNPLLCLPETPTTLWTLSKDPLCSDKSWIPETAFAATTWPIYRQNTVEYSTTAIHCTCTATRRTEWTGLFGGFYSEESTKNIPISISDCALMNATKDSRAGILSEKDDYFATQNTVKVDTPYWPFSMASTSGYTENCFYFTTKIFTRHEISTINSAFKTPAKCLYQSGSCQMDALGVLIWTPDVSQQCKYIIMDFWNGTFSTNVWIKDTKDFALSFHNPEQLVDCNTTYMLAEQGFAVPQQHFNDTLREIKAASSRKKREVGIVYSTQLSAELQAIHTNTIQITKDLFSATFRQICAALQNIAEATLSLATSNPTLLARQLLNVTAIEAKLVAPRILEIKSCIEIEYANVHFAPQSTCYNKLPVYFSHQLQKYNAYLDPITMILETTAEPVNCNENPNIYIYAKKTSKV